MGWFKSHREEEKELETEVRYAAELHGVRPKEVVEAILDEDDEDELEELEDDERRPRVGLWVTTGTIGVVFGLGIVALMYLANLSDKSGPKAVAGIQAVNQSIAPTPQINPTLDGTHITFVYPAVFDEIGHPPNWPNTEERYALSSKEDYRKSIEVYVEMSAVMDMDSSYIMRAQDKADYTLEAAKVMGEPAVLFVKNDQSEETLFWQHGGSLVVFSALGEAGELPGYMSIITNSLRWVN